jgi:hypothetical protein
VKIYQIAACDDGNDDVEGKTVYCFEFGRGQKYEVVAQSQEEADSKLVKLLASGRVNWDVSECKKSTRDLSKRRVLSEECMLLRADLREAGVDVDAEPVEIEVET